MFNSRDRGQWQQFFKDFSYKPNWEFEFRYSINTDTFKVIITMRVPDSRRELPQREIIEMGTRWHIPLIPVTKTVTLGVYESDEYAQGYIRYHISDMENHEIDEWFKHKGVLVFDPHA